MADINYFIDSWLKNLLMKSLRKSGNKEDEYLWLSTINPSTPLVFES